MTIYTRWNGARVPRTASPESVRTPDHYHHEPQQPPTIMTSRPPQPAPPHPSFVAQLPVRPLLQPHRQPTVMTSSRPTPSTSSVAQLPMRRQPQPQSMPVSMQSNASRIDSMTVATPDSASYPPSTSTSSADGPLPPPPPPPSSTTTGESQAPPQVDSISSIPGAIWRHADGNNYLMRPDDDTITTYSSIKPEAVVPTVNDAYCATAEELQNEQELRQRLAEYEARNAMLEREARELRVQRQRGSSNNFDGDTPGTSQPSTSIDSNTTPTAAVTIVSSEPVISIMQAAPSTIASQSDNSVLNAQAIQEEVDNEGIQPPTPPSSSQQERINVNHISPSSHNDGDGPRKRRRTISIIMVLIVMLVAIAISLGIVFSSRKDGEEPPSTQSPLGANDNINAGNDRQEDGTTQSPTVSPASRMEWLRNVLLSMNNDIITKSVTISQSDTNSPQFQTMDWLVNNDDLQLVPTTTGASSSSLSNDEIKAIRNRYALGLFAYSMGGTNSILHTKFGWLSGDPTCSWGVDIDTDATRKLCNENDDVVNKYFSGELLSGTIPAEIGVLTSLTQLYLRGNDLSGTIPSEIGSLTKLTRLDLGGISGSNSLSGTMPSEIGLLAKVTYLSLSLNSLTGTIPTEIGLLTNLNDILSFSTNNLSGTIPTELGLLSNVDNGIYLLNNNLNGNINDIFCDSSLISIDRAKFPDVNFVRVDCAGNNPTIICNCCEDWEGGATVQC